MNYLVLDQALQTTGWAFFKNDELIDYGSFHIPANKPIEQRLGLIWQELNDLNEKFEHIDFVIIEDIQYQNNIETYKKLAYVQAAILLWCYFSCTKSIALSPSHWRSILKEKYKISFGRTREEQKKAAIDFIQYKYNENPTSDEADAICIGCAGIIERLNEESAF